MAVEAWRTRVPENFAPGYEVSPLSEVYGFDPEANIGRWLKGRDIKKDTEEWPPHKIKEMIVDRVSYVIRSDGFDCERVGKFAYFTLLQALQHANVTFEGFTHFGNFCRFAEIHEAAHVFDLGVQGSMNVHDIADDKRRDRVYRLMQGWGDRLQYSTWRVLLGRKDRIELEAALAPLIHAREDQVILVDLGPSQGRALQCLHTIGRPQASPPADKPHIF